MAKPSKMLLSEGNIQIINAEPQTEVLSVDDISRFYSNFNIVLILTEILW